MLRFYIVNIFREVNISIERIDNLYPDIFVLSIINYLQVEWNCTLYMTHAACRWAMSEVKYVYLIIY
jgi:hypothetical protein